MVRALLIKEVSKMARAKRPSDELYNARRRAKRQAERMERAGNAKGAAILRQAVSQSYGKAASVGISELASALGSVTDIRTPSVEAKTDVRPTQRAPRPKRPSDEIYNARRRLRRQAEKVQREAKQLTGTERKLAEGYAQYLMQQAKATGRLSDSARKDALDRLDRIREATKGITYEPFRIRRRNAIIMQQLNAAGTEGADSNISERKKDVFWASTKGLWPKGSQVARNERYDLILSHFYIDNTTDAKEFRKWLEEKKHTTAQDSFGDLQLVYEYLTEELNDPALYELPELPYAAVMDLIKTAM